MGPDHLCILYLLIRNNRAELQFTLRHPNMHCVLFLQKPRGAGGRGTSGTRSDGGRLGGQGASGRSGQSIPGSKPAQVVLIH